MEGTGAPGSEPKGARRLFVTLVVLAALGASVAAGGVWYLVTRLPTNTPPHGVSILVSPSNGDNETTFTFSAQASDDQDNVSKIRFRWDWENDSVWDTAWSATGTVGHQFPGPGDYVVGVEAVDTGDLTATATRQVRVTRVPLRIGTVLPITGALSVFGVSQQNAVEMAVAEINADGGVFGEPVQLFSEDDQTSGIVANEVTVSLITAKRVAAIIGSTASGSCVMMLPVVQAHRVLEVAPGCTSPLFSDPSRTQGWFARTVVSEELQGAVGAWFARVNLSYSLSGVVATNDPSGTGIARAFVDNFTRLGGSTSAGSPVLVNPSLADYTSDLHTLLDTNPPPEVVYAALLPPTGVVMIRDWWIGLGANPGWRNVTWLFSDGGFDQAGFIDPLVSAGVNVSDFQGTIAAEYAGISPPRYPAWAARYQSRFGAPPTLFAANAYDATYLVALAAEAAGFPTGEGIRAHLRAVASPAGTMVGPAEWTLGLQEIGMGHDVNYDGASGSVDLDVRAEVIAPYAIFAVNSSNQLYVNEVFNESLVSSLLPPGFASHDANARIRDPSTMSSLT